MRNRISLTAAALCFAAALTVLVAWLTWANGPVEEVGLSAGVIPATSEVIARGAYLARAGNCMGCHTTAGGAAYAGGRGIQTPFGAVYASNLTPDNETGLGRWSASQFWTAIHLGRSMDGRLLYPAFPYPNFTQVTREDSDAIYAFLRTLAPVKQGNKAHDLGFPFNLQLSLALWRALYFSPGQVKPDPGRSPEWNRGNYLVNGFGHCAACHSTRNALGAIAGDSAFGGGLMPASGWYAPSLASPAEAGLQDWPIAEIVALLKSGSSARGSAIGPMAEVVSTSTQHLHPQDLAAMAAFLKDLPRTASEPGRSSGTTSSLQLHGGQQIYANRCASCHGAQGEGKGEMYPPLAGNRAVNMSVTANLVKAILHGGFAPATAGNPRPFGMPPFGHELADSEIAAVATYVRQSWGNSAPQVSALDVLRAR